MFIHASRFSILACLLAAPAAHAQFAVIDVSAITQLIQQARTLESQLSTARDHLAQAQAEFATMTGNRGMERLLAGVQRNYLPADWAQLQYAMQGSYGALGGSVAASVSANAVLSSQQLAGFSPEVRQQIDAARRVAALHQSVAREALATTSNRFASVQQLIDALAAADDQKAVLDLQARIAAENAMLENEQTKLQILNQVIQSEERASLEQIHERAIAGHGWFSTRFRPTP